MVHVDSHKPANGLPFFSPVLSWSRSSCDRGRGGREGRGRERGREEGREEENKRGREEGREKGRGGRERRGREGSCA